MSARNEDLGTPPLPTGTPRLTSRKPYVAPAITWIEAYEPMSFGVSCAKQPGNPPCNSGPFSS